MDPWDAIWLFFILSSLQPCVQQQLMAATRRRLLGMIASKRSATVITLIHRQETLSLLGIPIVRHIDIDDAQSVLRAIRETPAGNNAMSGGTLIALAADEPFASASRRRSGS